jgi:DNA-binding protein Fis
LRKVLARAKWNRRRAADELGIGYSTLKVKLKTYGLVPADDEED